MSDKQEYGKWVKIASRVAVLTAVTLLVTKLVAWMITGSASLLASMTDSLLDLAASVLSLFAVRYALEPADREHSYGHGKAESLAGLAQAAFVTGSSLLLIFHGISVVIEPHEITRPSVAIYVSLFSIVATLGLVTLQRYVVRKTQSLAIEADSMHYTSDILLNASVLVAVGLSAYGILWADGLIAIGIGLFLMHSAYEVGKKALGMLLDSQLPEEELQEIEQICIAHTKVHGIHDLRTRQSGHDKFIQLHLELDDDLRLREAHEIADAVERDLKARFENADVIIHQDPLSVLPKEYFEQIHNQARESATVAKPEA